MIARQFGMRVFVNMVTTCVSKIPLGGILITSYYYQELIYRTSTYRLTTETVRYKITVLTLLVKLLTCLQQQQQFGENLWILGYNMYPVIYSGWIKNVFLRTHQHEGLQWSPVCHFQGKSAGVFLLFSVYWKPVHITLGRKRESVNIDKQCKDSRNLADTCNEYLWRTL